MHCWLLNCNKCYSQAYLNKVLRLKSEGTNFDFRKSLRQEEEEAYWKYQRPDIRVNRTWSHFFSYETGLVVSLIPFSGLCMAAMCQILCDPGRSYLSTWHAVHHITNNLFGNVLSFHFVGKFLGYTFCIYLVQLQKFSFWVGALAW